MALEFGITLVFVPRTDRRVQLTSLNFAGPVSFCLDAVPDRQTGAGPEEDNWGNFARGAATALQSSGHRSAAARSRLLLLSSKGSCSAPSVVVLCQILRNPTEEWIDRTLHRQNVLHVVDTPRLVRLSTAG